MYQTLRNLRQKIVMLKIKLQPYTMNIIFIYNQYFNKMEKISFNIVDIFCNTTIGGVHIFVYLTITVLALIILYKPLKKCYKIQKELEPIDWDVVLDIEDEIKEEKEKETKITARRTEAKFDDEFSDKELKYIKKSMIEKIGCESNKEANDMAFDIINVCQELLGEPQFESVDEIVSFNF